MSLKKKSSRNVRVIAVSGSPGCGKTTLCARIQEQLGTRDYMFINIGEMIKDKKLYTEWDDDMNCSIFDEDLVMKELRKIIKKNDLKIGILIDFHSLSFISIVETQYNNDEKIFF